MPTEYDTQGKSKICRNRRNKYKATNWDFLLMFLATLPINVDLSWVLDFVRSTIWRISFNYRACFALTLVPIRPTSGTMFLEIFHFYFVRFILRGECANVDRIIFKINCLSIRFVHLFYRLYRYNEIDTEARTDMRKWDTSDGKWNYYKEKNNGEANDARDDESSKTSTRFRKLSHVLRGKRKWR